MVFTNQLYHWIIVEAWIMMEDAQINSIQIKLDTEEDINMTVQYMEPKNYIIKACLNQIDNKAQQLL